MTARKERTTISIDPDVLKEVMAAAEEKEISVSAYVEKLARADKLRRNGRKYRQFMAELPTEDLAALENLTQVRINDMIDSAS